MKIAFNQTIAHPIYMGTRVYLDSAAAHPVRPKALRAFARASRLFGNPSAPHTEGREARKALEDARTRIARIFGAKPEAIIFTSGATESNALAIIGAVRARLQKGEKDLEVIYSPTQHASVIGAVKDIATLGVRTRAVPLKDGSIDLEALKGMLNEKIALITLDVVCGETGTRFDTRRVRTLIDSLPVALRPVFHIDATQAPLVENMDRTRLGADLISFDAQKIGGVRGIGALVAPLSIPLLPLVQGGGQERSLRSGTPSPALAQSFAVALEEAQASRETFRAYAGKLREVFITELTGGVVNGGGEYAPHIVNVSFPGIDTDYLIALLDEDGFAVATRSSCETDEEGSRVVFAYTNDLARSSATLRISFNETTREKDIRAFCKALARARTFLADRSLHEKL